MPAVGARVDQGCGVKLPGTLQGLLAVSRCAFQGRPFSTTAFFFSCRVEVWKRRNTVKTKKKDK